MTNQLFGYRVSWGRNTVVTSLVYKGNTTNASDLDEFTFSSEPIGQPHSSRWVIVAVGTGAPSAARAIPTGVTVGGISATKLAEATNGGVAYAGISIWKANVPTGTTADIVCTFSNTNYGTGIGVWRLIHSTGDTYDTDSDGSGTGGSLSINTAAKGALVAASQEISGNQSTWTGATERYDVNLESGQYFSGADDTETSEATGSTVDASNGQAQCCASWD